MVSKEAQANSFFKETRNGYVLIFFFFDMRENENNS